MKTRIIKRAMIFIVASNSFFACNSDEQKSEAELQCSSYDYRFGELKELINAINSHSTFRYKSYTLWDENTIQDIEKMISDLDTIKCDSKKNIDFASNQINLIRDHLSKEKQRRQEEAHNGDDLFMSGVKITSSKLLFDDDMNPIIEISLANNTNKRLTALNFLVNYCTGKQVTPLCYKTILIKGDVSPLSSKSLTFSLPKPAQMATDHPVVELVEILRADGVKVKTADGFRFSQQY